MVKLVIESEREESDLLSSLEQGVIAADDLPQVECHIGYFVVQDPSQV